MANTCTCCEDIRAEEGLPPRELVEIGRTKQKGFRVEACPGCDGEQIIDLSRRENA